ncbi:phage major tail tube protein [Pseudomonas syringae group genomosp. 3]
MTTVNSTAQLREALAAGTDPNTIEIAQASQSELETARTQASTQAVTAGRLIYEIDALGMKRVINGVDQLAAERSALGL